MLVRLTLFVHLFFDGQLIRLRGAQDSTNRELFRLRTQLQQQSAAAQEANHELSMTLT